MNKFDLDYLKKLEEKINKDQKKKEIAANNKERHVINTSILGSNAGQKDIFSSFKANEEESKKIKEYAQSKGYDMRSLSEIEVEKLEEEMRAVRVSPIINTDKIDESILLELDNVMAEVDGEDEKPRESTIYVKEPVQSATISEINPEIISQLNNEIDELDQKRPNDILAEEVKDNVTIDKSNEWSLDDIDIEDAFEGKSLSRLNDIIAKDVESTNTVIESVHNESKLENIVVEDEEIDNETKRENYENLLQDRNKIGTEPSVLYIYNKDKQEEIPETKVSESIDQNGEKKLVIETTFETQKPAEIGQKVSLLNSNENQISKEEKENIEKDDNLLDGPIIMEMQPSETIEEQYAREKEDERLNLDLNNLNLEIEPSIVEPPVNKELDNSVVQSNQTDSNNNFNNTNNSILNQAYSLVNGGDDDIELLSVSEVFKEEEKLNNLNKRLIEMRDKSTLDKEDVEVIKDTITKATETVKSGTEQSDLEDPLASLKIIKDIIQTKKEEEVLSLDLDEIDWGELESTEDKNPIKQELMDIASLIKEKKLQKEQEEQKNPLDLVLERLSNLGKESIAIKYTNKDLSYLDRMEISNMGYDTYELVNKDLIIVKSGNYEETFKNRLYVNKFVSKLKEEVLNFFNNGISSPVPLLDMDGLPIFTKEELDKITSSLGIAISFETDGELNTSLSIVGI